MSRRTIFIVFTLAIGLIFTVGDLSTLFAQESGSDEFTLEEITVTAQKREENQQKVPIAMEVLTGEDIREIGRNDIDEILGNVSSILTQAGSDGLRVSIRGISNDNNQFRMIQASAPTVAVNQDGVYSNRNGSNQSLFDIERVEVLFGPQSTMYASATPGGIVNVVTSDPKTDKYEASGTLEYGNYELLHTEGTLNVPLNDTMAIRAAFNTSVRDGYLSNGSMDEDSKSARIKALFEPNDTFSIVLTGELIKMAGQGFASIEAFVDQDDVDDPWTSSSENAGMGRDEKQERITAQMEFDTGIGTLSLTPSYTKHSNSSSGTEAGRLPPGMAGTPPTYLTTRSGEGIEKGVEVRMASSADSSFEWLLAVNMYQAEDEQSSVRENQETGDLEYNDMSNEQDTKAVYANLTYPLTDRFRVTAGARKSWDENKTVNYENPGKGLEGSSMEYDSPNYSIGAQYDMSENSMLYIDIASSYRLNAGGVTPGGVQLPPEELLAYTVGAKNRFFGNKLQLNASAYYYDYQDYYANMPPSRIPIDEDEDGQWDPATETTMVELVNIETGDAVVYGFDIQTSTIITDKDKVDFSVSYIKKYFEDLVFDFPDIFNSFGIDDLDYSDKDMPQAPNWRLSGAYNRNFNLPNGGLLTARLEANYTAKTCLNWMAKSVNFALDTDPPNAPPWEPVTYTGTYSAYVTDTSDVRWQEAYHIENISLTYMNPEGKWSLSAYVNNLTNYAVKRFLDGMGNMMIGNPRTCGAVLSVRY